MTTVDTDVDPAVGYAVADGIATITLNRPDKLNALTAPMYRQLIAAFGKGDVAHAREINARLLESYVFESGDAAPNPIPTKAMMRTLGLAVGECRLPMGPTPEGLEAQAREVYANLHA